MDRNAHGASLAACQQSVTGPIRPVVAIHIACEIARLVLGAHTKESSLGKRVTHVSITPENIFIGYDGNVEVLGIPGMQRLQASPPNSAYHAPEQVSGSATDLRTEVFALGVVLWELFAGQSLFLRETPAATRMAISEGRVPYVCDSNPEVPKPIADTLVTALRFDKQARFESVEAFAKALVGARAASGISAAAHKMDIAAWLSERVPRPGAPGASNQPLSVPPLGGLPISSPPARSAPPFVAPMQSPPQFGAPLVPDLELAPSTRMPALSSPPASNRAPVQVTAPPPASVRSAAPPPAAVRSAAPPDPNVGAGRSITFDDDDGDDFDMQIERNVASTSFAHATSSRAAGPQTGARPSGGGRPGLELSAPSRMAREPSAEPQYADEPGTGIKLAGLAISATIAGGVAFSLWKFVYHARGFDLTHAMPRAFDGTSAIQSGAIALGGLFVAVALAFIGLRVRPHAWTVVAAGGLALLLAIAMVTVALGSTGENSVPPDGGLLVPYLLPATVLLFSLGLVGLAGRRFAVAYGARKALSIPIATIAGAVGYLAFELSRFAR